MKSPFVQSPLELTHAPQPLFLLIEAAIAVIIIYHPESLAVLTDFSCEALWLLARLITYDNG